MLFFEGIGVAIVMWVLWGLMRLNVSPNYKKYKDEHPGHWL